MTVRLLWLSGQYWSGEHYIIDAILGALYAFAVEYGCRAWERRSARRGAFIGVDESFKTL
jgi:hypothetical protein